MIKKLGTYKDFDDNTLKSVYEKDDNKIIEMSLLFNKDKMDVVCAPTHHFCNLGCKMCHLTNKGLNKKMISINVDDFIVCLIDTLTKDGVRRTQKKKLLISFMGVGDPTLNLDLIKNIYLNENILKEKLGYESISYALATMMPGAKSMSNIIDLVKEYDIPLKVHFSLHSPIEEERKKLIPNSGTTIIDALKGLCEYRNTVQKNKNIMNEYIKFHRTDDPVEIHYTLIKEVNDGMSELDELINYLKEYQIPIKFIKFNPTKDLKESYNQEYWVYRLKKELPDLRIKTYSPPGKSVGSSCGEFTKHYYHEEIETKKEYEEFIHWKNYHEIEKEKILAK